MNWTFELRCPYCLQAMDVPTSTSVQAVLNCPKCRQRFDSQNARAAESKSAFPAGMGRSGSSVAKDLSAQAIVLGALGSALPGLLSALATIGIRGPEFVLIFALESGVLVYVQYFVRHTYQDSMSISLFAVACIVATATMRFIYGSLFGMHDFTMMFIILIAAKFVCFFRDDGRRDKGSGGCSSGGGCGSSGSGGCGGCGGD